MKNSLTIYAARQKNAVVIPLFELKHPLAIRLPIFLNGKVGQPPKQSFA
jgi:hypothetical protein